jgi:hypothetical protein
MEGGTLSERGAGFCSWPVSGTHQQIKCRFRVQTACPGQGPGSRLHVLPSALTSSLPTTESVRRRGAYRVDY